jgi:enterochelin esterase-like enzyme
MIKKVYILALLTLCSSFLLAQGSRLEESIVFPSKVLGKDVKFSIYLPAGYETSTQHYPVLYLLHGYSDDETGWTQFGQVQPIADKSIASGEAPPTIIVMPDGGVSFYINSYDNKVRYEEFFINEFLPHIERTYRTRAKKEFRAIAGLSMGGYGALVMSLKHPELFGSAAPLSAAVWTDEEILKVPEDRWDNFMGIYLQKGLKGKDRLSKHYLENSPLKIVETAPLDKLKSVRFYIDCGDDDFLIKGNMALHAAMIDKGVPHEFRVRDGGHSWSYWRSALPDVFKFVGKSFTR